MWRSKKGYCREYITLRQTPTNTLFSTDLASQVPLVHARKTAASFRGCAQKSCFPPKTVISRSSKNSPLDCGDFRSPESPGNTNSAHGKHNGPGSLPGRENFCRPIGLKRTLRPPLRGFFPPRRAGRLRILVDCRLRNSDRLLRGLRCQRRLRNFLSHLLGFIGGKQWSHHPQSFYFLFEPGELELFLSQYFINVLHILGTCSPLWDGALIRTLGTVPMFVKHLEWCCTQAGCEKLCRQPRRN